MYEKITNTVGTILVYVASIGLLGGQNTYARGVDDCSREVTNKISNKSGGCIRTPLEELINKPKSNKQTISCHPTQEDYDHECPLCRPGGKKKPEKSEFPNIPPGVIDPAPSYDLEGQLGKVNIGLSRQYSGMFPKNPFDVGTGPYNPRPEEVNTIRILQGTKAIIGDCWPEPPNPKPFPKPKPRPSMWEPYDLNTILPKLKMYGGSLRSQLIKNSAADEYRETRGKEPPGAGPTPEQDRERTREKDKERDRREHEKREKENNQSK